MLCGFLEAWNLEDDTTHCLMASKDKQNIQFQQPFEGLRYWSICKGFGNTHHISAAGRSDSTVPLTLVSHAAVGDVEFEVLAGHFHGFFLRRILQSCATGVRLRKAVCACAKKVAWCRHPESQTRDKVTQCTRQRGSMCHPR